MAKKQGLVGICCTYREIVRFDKGYGTPQSLRAGQKEWNSDGNSVCREQRNCSKMSDQEQTWRHQDPEQNRCEGGRPLCSNPHLQGNPSNLFPGPSPGRPTVLVHNAHLHKSCSNTKASGLHNADLVIWRPVSMSETGNHAWHSRLTSSRRSTADTSTGDSCRLDCLFGRK